MKVLFDYPAFVMQPFGGVSRVIYETARHGMLREKTECSVWAGLHQNYAIESLSNEFPGSVHGKRIVEKFAKQRLLMPLNSQLFTGYASRYQPDICHYSFFMTPRVPARTKTVITVHDLINELFPQHYSKHDKQAEYRRRALQKVDGVVCVSEHTKNDFLKLYDFDDEKVIVAYNGNSLSQIKPIPPRLKDPYFLYVGSRNGWRKNFDILCRSFSAGGFPMHYKLVCFGDKPFSEAEKSRFQQLKIEDRILSFSGNDEELAGYYSNALALVYPSRYEGFGLPPIEAMGFGCPVIASDAPPMPEIIQNNGLFFDPESCDTLTSCMKKITKNSEENNELRLGGMKRAAVFNWYKSCEKVFTFYEKLIGM